MKKPDWLKKPKYIWPTVAKVSYVIVCIILIVGFGTYFKKEATNACPNNHAPSFKIEDITLTSGYEFPSSDIRSMAKIIYEYKSKYDYDPNSSDAFISLFAIKKPNTLPLPDDMSDIALYKVLRISPFNAIASYISIFNHPEYINCLKAYNNSTKAFSDIYPNRTTKDVIIRDILKIGDSSVSDLKESIKSYLTSINPTFDATAATQFENILFASDDEELYNLLNWGCVGLINSNNITT